MQGNTKNNKTEDGRKNNTTVIRSYRSLNEAIEQRGDLPVPLLPEKKGQDEDVYPNRENSIFIQPPPSGDVSSNGSYSLEFFIVSPTRVPVK